MVNDVGVHRAHLSQGWQLSSPLPLDTMLRIHCMQQWYNLSNGMMEDALHEIASMRMFAKISLDQATPDLTTIGMTYFLDHSELMQKVWNFLNQFKIQYRQLLEQSQDINTKLDKNLAELTAIEFNMNPSEFEEFTDMLVITTNEYKRSFLLHKEVLRRHFDFPFEPGISESLVIG
ncbi:hypothetical protein D3C84_836440 [compost metagenome]